MKQKSRTEYSVMNTTVAFAAQATAILMGFFTRVVFTRMLSEGYVGINGLFTDILNILSLSELGVGTAITYALYGPIARNDIKKQQILMRMFRTFYRITAGVVLIAGLCLIPFLDILMKDRPELCRYFLLGHQVKLDSKFPDMAHQSKVPMHFYLAQSLLSLLQYQIGLTQ